MFLPGQAPPSPVGDGAGGRGLRKLLGLRACLACNLDTELACNLDTKVLKLLNVGAKKKKIFISPCISESAPRE